MITAQEFKDMVGSEPIQDDLQRVNCSHEGEVGHLQCGICPDHKKPRFICGCWIREAK